MKNLLIAFTVMVSYTFISCSQKAADANGTKDTPEEVYANEYGEIRIHKLTDSTAVTVFINNNNETFDTVMTTTNNFRLLARADSTPFLQLKSTAIEWKNEYLRVHEFSDMFFLNQYISLDHLYDRLFYRNGKKITLAGDLFCGKGGCTLDGIYLEGYQKGLQQGREVSFENRYTSVTGEIYKEKYPRSFYSTDDSPQGMFSDTNVVHYRLVMKDYEMKEFKKETYSGTTVNLEDRAAFIYDFSDSEAFFLDKNEPWLPGELNRKIKIEAVLVQYIDGKSMLKNWRIVK